MGHSVPERVYRMNSTIKLLLIVRDPVERAISDWTQIWSNKAKRGQPYARFEDMVIDEQGKWNRYKTTTAVNNEYWHKQPVVTS